MGPVNNLSVQSLQLAHDNLIIDAGARIIGLPDSAQFTFDLSNSTFNRDDLSDLIPSVRLESVSNEYPLFFHTLYGKGLLQRDDSVGIQPVFGDAHFGFTSPGGSLKGDFEISLSSLDSLTYLYSIVEADSFNVSSLVASVQVPTSLNGKIFIEGAGEDLNKLETDIRISLSNSEVSGNSLDTLDTYLYARDGQLEFQGSVSSREAGSIFFDANYNLSANNRPLEANLVFDDLNVSPLIKSDSFQTNLDGSLSVDLTGSNLAALRGTVQVDLDSSSVTHGSFTHLVGANELTATLTDITPDKQRFSIDGDLGYMTVDGGLQPAVLSSLGTLWSKILSQNLSEIIRKERQTAADTIQEGLVLDSSSVDTVQTFFYEQLAQNTADILSEYEQSLPHNLDIDFELKQTEFIYPWFANVSSFYTDLQGSFAISSSP